MAKQPSKGDKVKWKTSGGSASGTVERVITSRVKIGGRTVAGSKDEPRFLVKNDETGKATVLRGRSLQAGAARRAAGAGARKPAARTRKPAEKTAAKPAARKAAAEEPAADAPAAPQPLKQPSSRGRWVAVAALLAAAAVVAGFFLLGGDDDEDSGDDETAITSTTEPTDTTATTTETSAPSATGSSPELTAAVEAQPFALRRVATIPPRRLGDEQDQLKSQFARIYTSSLAGIDETWEAAVGTNDQVASVAESVRQKVESDRAITDAFVANSFSDGDSPTVLAQKTSRTEAAVKAQLKTAGEVTPPAEAEELFAAFDASWKDALAYLRAVAAAIESRDQAALDRALSQGRAAALAPASRSAARPTTLQSEMQSLACGELEVTDTVTLPDGPPLAYRELGSGPPVLLLHGWPTSSFLWRNVMPPIARANRVIALDLPGFGGSDKPPRRALQLRVLRAGDRRLPRAARQSTAVAIAGHDLGGPVATHWALDRQERVTAFALLNTLVYPEFSEAVFAFIKAASTPGLREQITSPEGLEAVMRLGLADEAQLTDEVLAGVREPFQTRGHRAIALADAGIGLEPEGFAEMREPAWLDDDAGAPDLRRAGPDPARHRRDDGAA